MQGKKAIGEIVGPVQNGHCRGTTVGEKDKLQRRRTRVSKNRCRRETVEMSNGGRGRRPSEIIVYEFDTGGSIFENETVQSRKTSTHLCWKKIAKI